MAKPRGTTQAPVTDEVKKFLSANGRKGGATTRRLIAMGKQFAEEHEEDIEQEVAEDMERDRASRRKAS